jgi:hypothetical protein
MADLGSSRSAMCAATREVSFELPLASRLVTNIDGHLLATIASTEVERLADLLSPNGCHAIVTQLAIYSWTQRTEWVVGGGDESFAGHDLQSHA